MLIDRVERDHAQSDHEFRRRRVVVAATLAVGAILLGFSLSIRPGDAAFYLLTASVAATWVTGAALSGPLHLGWTPFHGRLRRPIVTPILTGLVIGGILAALLVGFVLAPQRRASGGILAPILTHVTWSTTMLFALPALIHQR
jgi:membrane protease YdiL (CAAX protease family)